jgi:hypothetical protein
MSGKLTVYKPPRLDLGFDKNIRFLQLIMQLVRQLVQ